MLPLVSIIMPAYNAEKYIGIAIESVLWQTYENWELIIVEDCSTDNTLKVIKNYDDSRIKLFQNPCNKGIAYSTNYGIEHSRGKYIALLDDDVASAERLHIQVDFLEKHENIDILGGNSKFIDAQGGVLCEGEVPRNNPKYIRAVLLFENVNFCNSTTMIRKRFMDKYNLRYHKDCYGMQDYRFFIESSKLGNISSVGDVLIFHRRHDASETKRMFREYKEERKITYAKFQRASLKMSGYELKEEKLSIINKAFARRDGGCKNQKELQLLYEALSEIMRQARAMKIDYYAELEHFCKLKLSEQIRNLIQF